MEKTEVEIIHDILEESKDTFMFLSVNDSSVVCNGDKIKAAEILFDAMKQPKSWVKEVVFLAMALHSKNNSDPNIN